MKMYFWRFLVAASICAATSMAGEPVKLDSVFNIDEVSFVKQPGDSTVTGTASIKLADGTIKNCAGFNVELLPIAAYAKERIVRTYGNDQRGQILLEQNPPKFTPDAPEYHDMLIKGACDARGEFRFSNVPAGDYFVMAFIIWEDASGATPRKTGGAAMKRIHVAAGSQVEALVGVGGSLPIDEKGFVPIGGIEQWITIKGTRQENPVVLFIHGGPGNSLSPFADAMFTGWEQDFTLVQWDQRGAGRTYGGTGPSIESTLTLDRIVEDGIEVAQYLTTHLHKKHIVIVGESWGSLVGVHLAKRRPDLFMAYVGTAQLVTMRTNTRASYDRVLAHARQIDDAQAVQELTDVGPPPFTGFAKWRTFRKWRNTYQAKLATAPMPDWRPSAEYATPQDLANSEAADDLNFAHFNFVGTSMTGPMMDIDLRALGREFKIPVHIIQGAVDLNAVPEVASDYLDWIRAPAKEFILVPGTAHSDSFASLAQVRRVLLEIGR